MSIFCQKYKCVEQPKILTERRFGDITYSIGHCAGHQDWAVKLLNDHVDQIESRDNASSDPT